MILQREHIEQHKDFILKTYNLLSDLIKSILRENKLKEIGI